jgi:hypothetical protein
MNIGFSNRVAYRINKIIDPGYILNTTVAYKLVVPPDGSYSVHINNALVSSGSVANDFRNGIGHPNRADVFQFSGLDAIGLSFPQKEAGSIFDDILLTTSDVFFLNDHLAFFNVIEP